MSNAMRGMALSFNSPQVPFDMEPQGVEDKNVTTNFSYMSLETPTSSLKPSSTSNILNNESVAAPSSSRSKITMKPKLALPSQ